MQNSTGLAVTYPQESITVLSQQAVALVQCLGFGKHSIAQVIIDKGKIDVQKIPALLAEECPGCWGK